MIKDNVVCLTFDLFEAFGKDELIKGEDVKSGLNDGNILLYRGAWNNRCTIKRKGNPLWGYNPTQLKMMFPQCCIAHHQVGQCELNSTKMWGCFRLRVDGIVEGEWGRMQREDVSQEGGDGGRMWLMADVTEGVWNWGRRCKTVLFTHSTRGRPGPSVQ